MTPHGSLTIVGSVVAACRLTTADP